MSVLACDIFARCSIRRRLSVGATFFKAGLLKYRSREFTVKLFQDEYRVPLLDPAVAARIAMMQELTIPILLFLGVATRIATLPLLGMIAVIPIRPEFRHLADSIFTKN